MYGDVDVDVDIRMSSVKILRSSRRNPSMRHLILQIKTGISIWACGQRSRSHGLRFTSSAKRANTEKLSDMRSWLLRDLQT